MNIVKITDGLGNQMFQYAFARKIKIMTGGGVYLDNRFINHEDLHALGKNVIFKGKLSCREYSLSHLNITLPEANGKILLPWNYLWKEDFVHKTVYALAVQGKWPWRWKEEYTNFTGKLSRLELAFPAYYQGYFFNLDYYDDIKPILQREFSLKRKMKLPADLRMVLKNSNTVSLHVRRGDFLKVNRDISSSKYYERAIRFIESKVEHPVYLVFSDDIDWVRKNMDIPGERIYISGRGYHDYEELAVMKHCRHNIIANSTFSYWAAYLNKNRNQIAVYPKHWRSGIIPEGWIGL